MQVWSRCFAGSRSWRTGPGVRTSARYSCFCPGRQTRHVTGDTSSDELLETWLASIRACTPDDHVPMGSVVDPTYR
jgi:hypothetical protein